MTNFIEHNNINRAWEGILERQGEVSVDKTKFIRYHYDLNDRKWKWETRTLTTLEQLSRKIFNKYKNVDENFVEGFKIHLEQQREYRKLSVYNDLKLLKGDEKDIYDYIKAVWGEPKTNAFLTGKDRQV